VYEAEPVITGQSLPWPLATYPVDEIELSSEERFAFQQDFTSPAWGVNHAGERYVAVVAFFSNEERQARPAVDTEESGRSAASLAATISPAIRSGATNTPVTAPKTAAKARGLLWRADAGSPLRGRRRLQRAPRFRVCGLSCSETVVGHEDADCPTGQQCQANGECS
jgi:hypothetical protein